MTNAHSWVVVADSPFLPARGGGEREHLGFVEAAVATGHLGLLVVPSSETVELAPYREVLGDVPLLVTRRRESKRLLASPTTPYVVASRPARPGLVDRVRDLAPDATGVVVFSYKSWRIGEAVAQGLGLPAVLRQHNLEGAYHRSLAAGTPGPRGLVLGVEARRIERDERRLEQATWLRAVADISATDAAARRARGATNALHVPPFAHDASLLSLARTPSADPRVLFIGALDVATNTDALEWVLAGVLPAVRAQVPDAVLDVVGRGPSPELRRRLEQQPGVALHADVPDIRPFLAQASVAVNPAVSGSGVNIKLVDYLQAGVPVVSTTIGAQGLGLADGDGLAVRDDAPGFAAAVVELLADRDGAVARGEAGRERVSALLDPVSNIARLEAALSAPRPLAAADGAAVASSARALSVDVAPLEWLAGEGRAEWDALFERQDGLGNPFCAPEWVETWYAHFTAPAQRVVLLVRRGDELVGVAPLFTDDGRAARYGIASRLRLVGAGQGGSLLELPQVLSDPRLAREVLREVVGATMREQPAGRPADWTEITVPTAQGWFEPEWAYSTGEKVAFHRSQLPRACVVLALGPDWESTRAGLKRNLKESLRRSRNRLSKDGRAWKVVPRTTDLDPAAVETFLRLHRQRSAHGSSVSHRDAYADPAYQAFLRDLLPALGRRGRATLLELHLDDRVVAVQLALHAPGVTYFHSSGVDPEVWSLGPVTFLQEQLVRGAVERGDSWINFSPGPNVAKLRWSSTVDVHQDFAYGCGGPALKWKYAAFAAAQALGQVDHVVQMSGSHAAPARADQPGPAAAGPTASL